MPEYWIIERRSFLVDPDPCSRAPPFIDLSGRAEFVIVCKNAKNLSVAILMLRLRAETLLSM